MRKRLGVAGVVGLGWFVGGLFEREVPVAQAGQEPGCAPLLASGGGEVVQDMNGDGVLDPIAEAVRLLSWAFLGAPAPLPPCAGRGPSGLPDTGLTKCYNALAEEVDCNSKVSTPCLAGQDGSYFTGCPSAGRFIDNGDDTVTDNCTGLMWQKDTADTDGDGQLTAQDRGVWCDAFVYCVNLSFAGHDDWRLPNIRELQSIVDYGLAGPSADPTFGTVGDAYWSSTTVGGFPPNAWGVGFNIGFIGGGDKLQELFVRAVRAGLERECAPLLVSAGGMAVVQDMNGDGVLDPIAEAVRLLSWAFLGAPAPLPPCGAQGLPDTGQTKCYGALGKETSCRFNRFVPCLIGQDRFFTTGCPPAGRFIDNGDGTVTDNCTGLMWRKETADMNGDGLLDSRDDREWCDAVAYCDDLSFAGHDDWRLPNIRELQSIVDYGLALPAIHPTFSVFDDHWSSTSVVGYPFDAWYVGFNLGLVSHEEKFLDHFVLAVRGGL